MFPLPHWVSEIVLMLPSLLLAFKMLVDTLVDYRAEVLILIDPQSIYTLTPFCCFDSIFFVVCFLPSFSGKSTFFSRGPRFSSYPACREVSFFSLLEEFRFLGAISSCLLLFLHASTLFRGFFILLRISPGPIRIPWFSLDRRTALPLPCVLFRLSRDFLFDPPVLS